MKSRGWSFTYLALPLALIAVLALLAISAELIRLALQDTQLGDRLSATAAVLGGMIGATGAALAVYLTLIAQRKDEVEKVEASLRAEVVEFARLAMGPLDVLTRLVLPGQIPLKLQDVPSLVALPEPVVFKATADRISRLPYGPLLVTFHMRIAEAKQMANIYNLSAPKSFADVVFASPEQTRTLATAWQDICIIARIILKGEWKASQLVEAGRLVTLRSLDESLEQADKVLGAKPP